MKAYVFPGQGAQFIGIGKDLYESNSIAKSLFNIANKILGFDISKVMFEGTNEELKQTKTTQPCIYIHSVISAKVNPNFKPAAVAGHSLGEFSALAAANALSFEDGLNLVYQRALAMQEACEATASSMAAILGLEDAIIEEVCKNINGIVVPANYNSPGQLVISGEIASLESACLVLKEKGAKRTLILPVGGAFHSPLMKPAQEKLALSIEKVNFKVPICPIYQNVNALPTKDIKTIKTNLITQLTAPVKWTQTINNMVKDGFTEFIEVGGNGTTLQGLIKKINNTVATAKL